MSRCLASSGQHLVDGEGSSGSSSGSRRMVPVPPHSSNESLAWLQQRFPDRPISRRCNTQGTPHSPDLNPPDFYLWGYLKDRVYGNNPQTIPDLKAVITAAIRAIPREECGRRTRETFLIEKRRVIEKRELSPPDPNVPAAPWSSFGAHFLSASETKSFCSTDLKLWRCLLHRLDLM